MTCQEILNSFETDSDVLQILDKLKPIFEKIEYYKNSFQNHCISANPEECKRTLDELTGLFMYLNPICSMAISAKKNKEDQYYVQRRSEIMPQLKPGQRFVSAPLDREASAHVKSYRTVRNLLQSYTDACDKAISSCQSMLKYMGEEIKLNK